MFGVLFLVMRPCTLGALRIIAEAVEFEEVGFFVGSVVSTMSLAVFF